MQLVARSPRFLLLAIAYLAFLSLGFPDAVTGVTWPSLRDTFDLPQAALGLSVGSLAFGYFLSGIIAGRLINALGIGTLLTGSTLAVASGLFGYAVSPGWAIFVSCSFAIGLGSGAVDTALNDYAAVNFPARHMNWLHAFFGIGATLGPLIMTAIVTRDLTWRWGYVVVASVSLLLAVVFLVTRHWWQTPHHPGDDAPNSAPVPPIGQWTVARMPMVWLQVAIFFASVGVETGIGQWAFSILRFEHGFSQGAAGTIVSLYWGGLAAGRIVIGAVADRVGPERIARFSAFGVLAGCALFASGVPMLSVTGLLITGFSLGPAFPTLMTLTPRRLGAGVSTHAIGFQVSAAVAGGAAVPALAGVLASRSSLAIIPWVIVSAAIAFVALHEWLLRLDSEPASAKR